MSNSIVVSKIQWYNKTSVYYTISERKNVIAMEINQLWDNVCQKLKEQVNDIIYNVWIEPLVPYDLINGNEIIIIAPSPLHRNVILDNHISTKIENAVYNTIGFEVKLRLLVKGEQLPGVNLPAAQPEEVKEGSWQDEIKKYENKQTAKEPEASAAPRQGEEGQMYSSLDQSNYEYTFDTFIVGSSNRFAHAASVAVAENPGGAYNPLFIYGPSGMGKTHLLFAIQNRRCVLPMPEGQDAPSVRHPERRPQEIPRQKGQVHKGRPVHQRTHRGHRKGPTERIPSEVPLY